MNPNEIPDTSLLPRDPATDEPLQPTPQPGYYPGFSTMSQKAFWDEATRNVITKRVEQPPLSATSRLTSAILAGGL